VLAPIGIDDFPSEIGAPPIHSRRDLVPIFDINNKKVASHLIFNTHYNVMRRGNRFSDARSNAIMEHIVATTGSPSVSLLYPEGQIFPRIFWFGRSRCDVVGALPSFLLNTSMQSPFNIASALQHQDVRIRDGDLLTCRESGYWHYMFDLKLNMSLNTVPSKVVFRRGLEFIEKDAYRHCGESSVDGRLPMDEAEASRKVKELSSMLKRCGKWTYFLTITCNDGHTPGVREITKAIRRVAGGNKNLERELTDNFLPFILRAWERFVRFFLQELVMRNDSIVGKVKNIFYRFEFQGAGAKGNKPHVHSGITLHDEPEGASVSRICCNSSLFHDKAFNGDFDSLYRQGIVKDVADYEQWQTIVACVNFHDCSATQFRCMKAINAAGERICRYHRQPPLPRHADPRGWFEEINMPYPEDVYQLLGDMGLAHKEFDIELECERWSVAEELKAGKWHYHARQNEFFIASIPIVSAICNSATNVDMCDRKFQTSYLVKYISGKEEHQLADVKASKTITEVTMNTQPHAHEKITGCQKLMSRKMKAGSQMAREICLAEIVWFVLGLPYTYCNAEFVHVPTLPLENRVGILRQNKNASRSSTDNISAQHGRIAANLPAWRLLSREQLAHVEDYIKSPYWTDVTSSFNVRPPELVLFDDLQLYSECFVNAGVQRCSFVSDVSCQPWFDGLSRRILLRSCSVEKAVSFVSRKAEQGDAQAVEMLESVFIRIATECDGYRERFVQKTDACQIVSVISLVKPWDVTKFLCHLCLSLGRYRTEVELFFNGTLKSAFVKAGLLPDVAHVTRADILSILRMYILQDLRFHPISARKFAKYIKAAMCALNDLLFDNVIGEYTPLVNDVMLKEQAAEVVSNKEEIRKCNIVSALHDDPAIRDLLPNGLSTCSSSSPLNWSPRIVATGNITSEIIGEQNAALQCCLRAIDNMMNASCRGVKYPCMVGRPGSGKSHVLKLATAYAVSKGLQVELMSFTSERSRKLGGSHMHLVFPFGVSSGRVTFSHGLAASCLSNLEKDPLRSALLKRTDVFVFEEIGLLSAEYFAAIDNVLRYLTGNSSPMGGKLFLSCGDSKQLPPIDGRPIWGSLNMCTMMDVFVFSCDVRARDDETLQRLNSDCRRPLSAVECTTLADTVLRECRFEPDWSSVPDIAVRIVPTKAAEMNVMEEFLRGRDTVSYKAIDEVQNGTVWERATERVTMQLTKNCYEYDVCKLYVNAVVRMTYNRRQDGITIFSQGQVAVVVRLATESDGIHDQRLTLRLAPPGRRLIDPSDIGSDWPEIKVGPRTTLPTVVGRGLQMGRRTQFPVRYYLASTIHRIQGDTVPLMATELSLSKRSYRLWQREQFAVLISRVQRCQDLIFVGSRDDTRAAIEHIMSCSSKWDSLVEHYLAELNVAVAPTAARRLVLDRHPFQPMYRELPSSVGCGYVFILISLACVSRCYIGETMDLKECLRKHNTGYGEDETRNTALHPWGVYGFVYGFYETNDDEGRGMRNEMVQRWRNAINARTSPDAAYASGVLIADEWMAHHGCQLTIVKCGQCSVN
jgi:Helitron helicase-like domain at N-terminus/PIF1-like helicase